MAHRASYVAVITGAASGLGEAAARRFAADGARVVLGDIQVERGTGLAAELGGDFLRCDVTDEADVEALVAAAVERHGRLDCMINNAGQLGALGSVTEIDASAWDRTIAVLLTSVFYGMKHAGRVMREQREGCILSTTSVAGLAALGPHVYTAAKHGVIGLTLSVASELAEYGVRVNAVAPGNVPTRMTELAYGDAEAMLRAAEARNPLKRVVSAEEVAGALAYLAGADGRNITGQVLAIDAGLTACRLDAAYYAKPASYFDAFGNQPSTKA
jgi:NAD(P)-dependent dehydrogenase (short-subunit alcohol dehydrogenase family)